MMGRGSSLVVRAVAALAVTFFAVGSATDVNAQAADAKRGLKAQKAFYAEPGMIDVELRAMRGTLMITGSVPNEDLMAKADELGGKIRGIKDVRNRLRVRPAIEADTTDAELLQRIEGKIEEDEDLARARRKFDVAVEGGGVTLKGKLKDYTSAQDLINDIRRIPGVQTIEFRKLKY